MDATAELAAILDSGAFTPDELAAARATAVDARSVLPANTTTLRVTTGYVLLWTLSRTFYLGVEGKQLSVGRRLYHALRDRSAYRVYFTGSTCVAIEPAPIAAVADSVADAARAAGFSRDDPRAATDSRVIGRLRQEVLAGFQRACEFSETDLARSRAGELTPNTTAKLKRDAASLFAVGAFVVVLAALFVVLSKNPSSLLYIGSGLCALLGAWFITKGTAHILGIARGRVEGAFGAADPALNQKFHTETAWLRTDTGQTLRVCRRAFAMRGFHPDALFALQYRLFFVPRTQAVLSLEPGPDLSPLFRPAPPRVDPGVP